MFPLQLDRRKAVYRKRATVVSRRLIRAAWARDNASGEAAVTRLRIALDAMTKERAGGDAEASPSAPRSDDWRARQASVEYARAVEMVAFWQRYVERDDAAGREKSAVNEYRRMVAQADLDVMTKERDEAYEAIRAGNVGVERTERDMYLRIQAAEAERGEWRDRALAAEAKNSVNRRTEERDAMTKERDDWRTRAEVAETPGKYDESDSIATGAVSVAEARAILQRFVDGHFGNSGERPRTSIPADLTRDDDIRLGAFITQSAAMREAVAELDAMTKEPPATHDEFARVARAMSVALDDVMPWLVPPSRGKAVQADAEQEQHVRDEWRERDEWRRHVEAATYDAQRTHKTKARCADPEYRRMSDERDAMMAERDAATRERDDAAVRERSTLTEWYRMRAERDATRVERDSMTAERDARDVMTAEWGAAGLAEMTADRDEWRTRAEKAEAEHDALAARTTAATAVLTAAVAARIKAATAALAAALGTP